MPYSVKFDGNCMKMKDDMLNQRGFYENLGNILIAYNQNKQLKDGIVFGFCGEWGSGKTSTIKMVEDYVKNEKKENLDFIYFNPWYFSDQKNLISKFFETLAYKISPKDTENDKSNRKIMAGLKAIAKILSPASVLDVSKSVEGLEDLLYLSQEYGINICSGDIDAIKEGIDEELETLENKIVIVIDDIDRLNDLEIRQTFQLVKSLANFKNIIYILSFDEKIVSNALDKSQEGHGKKYMEKIVQVQINMPVIHKTKLRSMYESEIDKIMGFDPKTYGKAYWDIYNNGLKYMITNIRDINRYINTLKINWNLAKDRVDKLDFITITAIQVFMPKLHDWIKNNKDACVCLDHKNADIKLPKENIKHTLSEILESYKFIDIEILQKLLFCMFPNLQYISHDNTPKLESNLDNDLNKKICGQNSFYNYFQNSDSKNGVSDKDIMTIIKLDSKEGIYGLFETYVDENLEKELFNVLYQIEHTPKLEISKSLCYAIMDSENIFYGLESNITYVNLSSQYFAKINSANVAGFVEGFEENISNGCYIPLLRILNYTPFDERIKVSYSGIILKKVAEYIKNNEKDKFSCFNKVISHYSTKTVRVDQNLAEVRAILLIMNCFYKDQSALMPQIVEFINLNELKKLFEIIKDDCNQYSHLRQYQNLINAVLSYSA